MSLIHCRQKFIYKPYYFEFKMLSNLGCTPLLKNIFASKYISLSIKFTNLLVSPLVLLGE